MPTDPTTSEYERLVKSELLYARGRRSPLTDEERKERRRTSSRLAMEARRRATAVLVTRHREEYDTLYDQERALLLDDPRYRLD